jgi:DNA-binding winged helix-turn-helix (wHTH) protein/tetratricopeptide (TPR) repeat protein
MGAMGRYVFGELELDAEAHLLRRAGREITLQPKVFDMLRYLIERPGRLVLKSELLDALWVDQGVNEAVVTWSMTHLRRALGQGRADKWPIETVHGRGYRFVAEVMRAKAPVHAPVPAALATAVPPAGSSTFVGRQRAFAELAQCLNEAIAGHGSLCALIGEAGIGKTRCAEELAKRAHELGMVTLLGRCPQAAGMPPFWPIEVAFSGLGGELAARARATFAQHAKHETGAEQRSDQGARFSAIEQTTGLLQKIAASAPILLVLDDVHWADVATLQWLSFVVSEIRGMRVCVVLTVREHELEAGSPRERQLRHVLRQSRAIQLGALGTEHVAELIKVLAGRAATPDLAEAVRKVSGGVPLFALEVIRRLLDDHGAQQLELLHPDVVRVPKVARDVLGERMRTLPDETFELLTAAAVIGESFDLSLLAALTELEPETLLERLSHAVSESKLVAEAPHVYRFAHALFHAVTYDSLPYSQRAALHRKVGVLLRERGSAPRAEIARHYYASLPMGDGDEVMRLAREAGDEALAGLEFEVAMTCFGWALEAQLSATEVAPRARAELLVALAVSQRSAGQTRQAGETCARAIELSMQHRFDDLIVRVVRLRRPTIVLTILPDPLARAALEHVLQRRPEGAEPARVSALAQLACTPPYDRELADSKQTSALALQLAEQSGQRDLVFDALRARLFSLSGPDDLLAALDVHDRMIALGRAGIHNWQTMDVGIWRVNAYLQLGRMAAADAALGELEAELAGRWGEALFYCLRMRALRAFHDGRFAEAEARSQQMLSHGVRAGVSYAEPLYGMQLVSLALEREGAAAVEKRLRVLAKVPGMPPAVRMGIARVAAEAGALDVVRAELASLGDPGAQVKTIGYLHKLACFAVCAIALDDTARCEQILERLAPYTALNTVDALGHYLGSVAHFTGLLAAALGRVEAARADFAQALAHNRAMGYRPGVVRTLLASARLEQGERAHELVDEAHTEAHALGMRV